MVMRKIWILLFLSLMQIYTSTAQAQKRSKKTRSKTRSEAYHIHFAKDSSNVAIGALMFGLAHPVTFVINPPKGKSLSVSINAMADPANIRINQVILPDGSSAGPFGKSITLPINLKGYYKIIVTGSNMQGDDFKGPFTLHASII
jgi:hypothetical protein